MARAAPAHLPDISGAELRRREARDDARPPAKAEPMVAYHPAPDLERHRREDEAGYPPGTALCWRCGVDVVWRFDWPSHEHPKNRDGSDHWSTCDPEARMITVGDSPRNSKTDSSGLRYYTWQGRQLPSVTTVRRMAGLPHGLHQWAISQVITAAMSRASEIAVRLAANDPTVDQAAVIRHELRVAATAERDRAAKLGTAVHEAAASGRQLHEVPDELRPRLAQYLNWLEVSQAEILAVEFQVWNPSVGYAGTADLLVRLRDGSIWIVDLKTGKGTYGEHALQLAPYLMAEFVGNDDVVNERLTSLLHQASGIALLHLEAGGWEFRSVRADAPTWTAFRGLLAFASWMREHEDVDSVTLASKSGRAA